MFVSRRRRTIKAEIDWLGATAGSPISAADYRKAVAARMSERDLQRDALDYFRRALPAGTKIVAFVNQRDVSHLTEAQQRSALRALVADGMEVGATDLHFAWDRELGAEGNEGVAYIELKRPVRAKPPTKKQIDFIAAMRALGKVAGIAKSLEDIEDLLIEAGAPLRFRLPRQVSEAGPGHGPEMERARATAIASAPKPIRKGHSR